MKKHSHPAEIATTAQAEAAAAESPAVNATATVPAQAPDDWKTKAAEHWDRFVRVAADFENFKKRAARERQEPSRYANESLLQNLIPVLDNFEAALAAAGPAESKATPSLQAGIAMIHQQLKSVLADAGLEEVDATGKPFDPNFHEAVS